ncbi:glycerate kinase [Sneathiella sp. HT1-7]|uniref:glycerate kinase type-2 family protein n=1 Tax=Sneathiella sp. HT1-7 TaxID=2887192 RepID=UPI001D13B857|nr:glycerate kinase [Sneathiella sp. HT1-7]MCC3305818.1 glycerate kinase [Sneathiella sp. HT1-7]
MVQDARLFLTDLFAAATAAADPRETLFQHLPPLPKGRTVVIGAGKAAASMAQAVEENWKGPLEGLVITRYEHGLPLKKIKVVEAGHPVPDKEGAEAANDILRSLEGLTEDDLVLCLISGGGSSLLAKPGDGITLEEKKAVTKALLASGANITEMNTLRKHLSAIKGGRLAVAAYPAKVVTLMISDVPGDDPAVIASGPTVPDATTSADARAVLEKYNIDIPPSIDAYLNSPASKTPEPDHPAFANAQSIMIATPQASLRAAADLAGSNGITPIILGDSIEGEARDVASVMAAIARQVKLYDQPAAKPCVLISGGETTVTVKANDGDTGRGGRNCEFLLALALHLNGLGGVYALACDTDGIDGTEDNAGAIITPDTLKRASEAGLNAKEYLARHDSYCLFDALGDLIKTGPTRTNVNDFRAILIL